MPHRASGSEARATEARGTSPVPVEWRRDLARCIGADQVAGPYEST